MVESSESILHILYHIHTQIDTYIYISLFSYITYFAFPNQGLPVKRNSRGQDRQTANLSPAGETAATYSAYIKDLDQLLLDASFTLLTSLLSLSVFIIHVILMIVHFQTQMSLRLELFPNCLGRPVVLPSAGARMLLDCIAFSAFSLFDLIGFAVLPCFATLTSLPRALGLLRTCSDLRWGGFLSTLHYRTSAAVGKLPSFPRPARHSPRYFVVACCAISFVGDLLAAVECQWWTQSCELKAEICSGSKLSNFQETLVQ